MDIDDLQKKLIKKAKKEYMDEIKKIIKQSKRLETSLVKIQSLEPYLKLDLDLNGYNSYSDNDYLTNSLECFINNSNYYEVFNALED